MMSTNTPRTQEKCTGITQGSAAEPTPPLPELPRSPYLLTQLDGLAEKVVRAMYTAEQMQAYALAERMAERERALRHVQYWLGNGSNDRYLSQCISAIRGGKDA